MKRKKHSPVQIIAKLRDADAILGGGGTVAQVIQPLEAPVQLPEPDELESDFKRLKEWQGAFKKRPQTKAQEE